MNIKIKKIIQFILWQGFEKPVTKIQKIVSIIIIFLNIFVMYWIYIFINLFKINEILKIILISFFFLNIMLSGCYFSGDAFEVKKFKIDPIGLFPLLFLNLIATIIYLNKKYKKN